MRTALPFLLILIPCWGSVQAQVPDELDKQLNKYLKKTVKQKDITGLAAAVVTPEQTKYYTFGHLSKDKSREVDTTTQFQIGSLTKTFTTLLLQRAIAEGKVSDDDPVNQWLPDSAKLAGDNADSLKIWHLYTHTGAIPPSDVAWMMEAQMAADDPAAFAKDPFGKYTKAHLMAFTAEYEPEAELGETFIYSNQGFALLGYVVEQVYGRPFYEIYPELFEALGMEHASLYTVPSESDTSKLAKAYNAANDATPWMSFRAMQPAGAILSDITDLAKYMRVIFKLEDKPELFEALVQCNKPVFEIDEERHLQIGKAWFVQDAPDKTAEDGRSWVVFHDGSTTGHRTHFMYMPQYEIGVIVMANRYLTDVNPANEILKRVLDYRAENE